MTERYRCLPYIETRLLSTLHWPIGGNIEISLPGHHTGTTEMRQEVIVEIGSTICHYINDHKPNTLLQIRRAL